MSLYFHNAGYDESVFSEFYVARDHGGPGWFIHGRNKHKYGTDEHGKGRYVMLCGTRTERKYARNFNGRVRHGWRTKGEAESVLARMLDRWPNLANGGVATINLENF